MARRKGLEPNRDRNGAYSPLSNINLWNVILIILVVVFIIALIFLNDPKLPSTQGVL